MSGLLSIFSFGVKSLIGILAGMGPKSTGPFVDQVVASIQRLTGAKNDMDFPPMMIYSLPTPFYIDRPMDHNLMQATICQGLKKLESTGVSFIAMPCNSVHIYYPMLEQCIQIPLLNMIEETLSRCPRNAKKVTLLATRSLLSSNLYQEGLNKAKIPYFIDLAWQDYVDKMILSIKSSLSSKEAISIWKILASKIEEAGVDTILLACTDLNVILSPELCPFHIVDSSKSLAEAATQKWMAMSR